MANLDAHLEPIELRPRESDLVLEHTNAEALDIGADAVGGRDDLALAPDEVLHRRGRAEAAHVEHILDQEGAEVLILRPYVEVIERSLRLAAAGVRALIEAVQAAETAGTATLEQRTNRCLDELNVVPAVAALLYVHHGHQIRARDGSGPGSAEGADIRRIHHEFLGMIDICEGPGCQQKDKR